MNRYVVNTVTKEEWDEVKRIMGYEFENYTWYASKGYTCISLSEKTFGSVSCYEELGYEVIRYREFIEMLYRGEIKYNEKAKTWNDIEGWHKLFKNNEEEKMKEIINVNPAKKVVTRIVGNKVTQARTSENDTFDAEKGYLIAFYKATTGCSNTQFKKKMEEINELERKAVLKIKKINKANTFKVRINHFVSKWHWYSGSIGEIFEVEECMFDDDYRVVDGTGHISKCDCEIVEG